MHSDFHECQSQDFKVQTGNSKFAFNKTLRGLIISHHKVTSIMAFFCKRCLIFLFSILIFQGYLPQFGACHELWNISFAGLMRSICRVVFIVNSHDPQRGFSSWLICVLSISYWDIHL